LQQDQRRATQAERSIDRKQNSSRASR
jgi:hypothetical protein